MLVLRPEELLAQATEFLTLEAVTTGSRLFFALCWRIHLFKPKLRDRRFNRLAMAIPVAVIVTAPTNHLPIAMIVPPRIVTCSPAHAWRHQHSSCPKWLPAVEMRNPPLAIAVALHRHGHVGHRDRARHGDRRFAEA